MGSSVQYKFCRDIDIGHFVIINDGSLGAIKSKSTYSLEFIMALRFYLLGLVVSGIPMTYHRLDINESQRNIKCLEWSKYFLIFSSVLPIWFFHCISGLHISRDPGRTT